MLAELGAALERAAGLNAEATALAEAQPDSTTLASALREALAAAWEEGFAAGRASGYGQPQVPVPRPELRLVAGG